MPLTRHFKFQHFSRNSRTCTSPDEKHSQQNNIADLLEKQLKVKKSEAPKDIEKQKAKTKLTIWQKF